MGGRYWLVLVCIVLMLPVPAIAGGQQSAQPPSPVAVTVDEPVALDTSHTTASVDRTALRDWQASPNDAAAFYRVTGNRLFYYDATNDTLHAIPRPNGRTFLQRDLVFPSHPDYILPVREQARYTDRGTIAIGTTYGPMIYDVSTRRWLTDPRTPLEGHPVERFTATNPSAVATADRYYVMTRNSELLLGIENWTSHVDAPPGDPERFRANDTHVSTNARAVTYSALPAKVGYPIVFRGAIGVTDREPDRLRYRIGAPDWPVWDPLNEDLTYFAPAGAGPTQVFDGTGSGTVVILGGDLVAYNVTTAAEEWRRDRPGGRLTRHDDRLVMHHRWINLTTGNATSLYAGDQQSTYNTEVDGERVFGEFETVHSVTPDGEYVVVKMAGESRLGRYQTRGVRVVNTETRTIAAQRISVGRHEALNRELGYRVAASQEHAVIASPVALYSATSDSESMAQVVDLRTNETVAELPFAPGRVSRFRATEDGLLLVPQFASNLSRDRAATFGRVTGNYTVYDPAREAVVGRLPVTLAANETIDSVRVRDGDLFIFTRVDGRTVVREYDGLDESLTVTASTSDDAVVVRLSELGGDPVANATVELGDERRTTNESGQARFVLDPPSTAGDVTHEVRVQAGDETHSTQLTVRYEQPSPTQAPETESAGSAESGGTTGTAASGPGLGLVSGLVAVLSLGWLLCRRVP
ncbi:hypothetical protein [Haloglomus litoreum]|uniref:hypothetical protein n=1 Tax=Haloglomus litoreum TaxID=3034026 RepID=UPI0023E8A7E0|nr:hypothetical protein [Haloglomus sp. DT116]